MARKPTTREWTLLIVVAIVGLVALWIKEPGLGLGGGPAATGVEAPDLGQPPVVMLAKLEPVEEQYDPSGRNLFEYYTPPPPPRPKPQPRPPRPVVKPPPQKDPSRVAPQTNVVRDTGPRPPRISFLYLGYLGHKDNKIAVFEDGEEIILAHGGETVLDQFRVVDFQYEKIVMGYVDEQFADETTELKQRKGR